MVCMGGPTGKLSPCRETLILNTQCFTQYITLWPLTHPRSALAVFSFSMARDTRQRHEVFWKELRHLTSITDIWISPDCYGFNFLKVEWNIVSGILMWKQSMDLVSRTSRPHMACTQVFGVSVTLSFSHLWSQGETGEQMVDQLGSLVEFDTLTCGKEHH